MMRAARVSVDIQESDFRRGTHGAAVAKPATTSGFYERSLSDEREELMTNAWECGLRTAG